MIARVVLKRSHKGSDLGWFWAIFRPLAYITMFYLAITTGFRASKDIDGLLTPYFVWMASGMIPWFYMQSLITGGENCFIRYKSLVTKIKYPITTLPTIPVLMQLIVHLVMIGVMFIIALLYGVRPSIYWLQIPFYLGMMIILVYFWSLMMGLLKTVSEDISDFVKAIKPAFFWLSGVLFNSRTWNTLFFKLNPITYLVEGYRNAMCFHIWFWEMKTELYYFCLTLSVIIIISLLLFKRLDKELPQLL